MAAKPLHADLDLDLAFGLQIQEAMDASLADLQPSTPRSPAPLLLDYDDYDEDEDDGFLITSLHNDDFGYYDGDVSDLAVTLMLADLEKNDDDRAQCEAEMRKLKEDLDRRIHDQKLATDISNLPDDEWEAFGDDFHRPYSTEGSSSSPPPSSSSSALVATECFRVYFKGLVSEERVRDEKVMVAGIGAVVCDARDTLIFDVKKPLEASVGGDKVLSSESAELEALIKGLDAALYLDLERVTFFCEDYMLYQYVTNRLPPRERGTAELVNQVALLQRKFTYCNASLVARNDIKFAFKLARDAIVSQITSTAETSKGKSLMETCVICFEDTDVDQMFSVDGCLHRYCFSCMKQHVEVKLLNGMVAKCPHEGCNSEVNIDSCEKILAPKLIEVMSQRMKESSIPIAEKVYCPYPRCSALMSKGEVLEYTKTVNISAEQSGTRKCKRCRKLFCINCKVPWHHNMTCYDYKRSNSYLNQEDAKLKSLATKKLWRECVKCNNMVELSEGCYHITCRCAYEFCYTCGAEWKNKKATCSCPIWDERNIIHSD